MRGKVSKDLRRMAREEGLVNDRDLVASSKTNKTGVNSPDTARALYLQLKKAFSSFSRK